MESILKAFAEQSAAFHREDQRAPEPFYLSGLGPGEELIPECEIIWEDDDDGLDSKFDWCAKNPKHKNFIPLVDFTVEHLPPQLRSDEIMEFVKVRIDLTVRIKIPYTSKDRPDYVPGEETEKKPYPYMHHKGHKDFTRNGTGTVMSVSAAINEKCPCPHCKKDDEPKEKYFLFVVQTVTHNVFNDEEAKIAVVDCFFNHEDDEEKGIIQKMFGLYIDNSGGKKDTMYETDVCDLVCVLHDSEIAERMSNLVSSAEDMPNLPDSSPYTQVIISHPHGCTKRISIGTIAYLTIPVKPGYKINTPFCLPKGITKCFMKRPSSSSSSSSKEGIKEVNPGMEKEEIQISPGMTFTLPKKAEYAMKYHFSDSPRYLTFFPGTTFALPKWADKTISIPDEAEFELDSCFIPEHYHSGNIIGACAGTSGAMVYSNLMEDEVLTDMSHTSKLRSDIQCCLTRQKTTVPE